MNILNSLNVQLVPVPAKVESGRRWVGARHRDTAQRWIVAALAALLAFEVLPTAKADPIIPPGDMLLEVPLPPDPQSPGSFVNWPNQLPPDFFGTSPPPIPPGFFDNPLDVPVAGVNGNPAIPTPPPHMVLAFPDPFDLPLDGELTVDIEIIDLQLQSIDPIQVQLLGQPEPWLMQMGLSPQQPTVIPGQLFLEMDGGNPDGFRLAITVLPRFVFIPLPPPSPVPLPVPLPDPLLPGFAVEGPALDLTADGEFFLIGDQFFFEAPLVLSNLDLQGFAPEGQPGVQIVANQFDFVSPAPAPATLALLAPLLGLVLYGRRRGRGA